MQQYLQHDASPGLRFRFACAAAGLLREMENRSNNSVWGRHIILIHVTAILKLFQLLTFDEAGWRQVLSVEGVRLVFQILSDHVLYDDDSSKTFEVAVARACHDAFDWIWQDPAYTSLKIEQALGKGAALHMAFSVCSMCAVRDLDSSAHESDLNFLIAHTSHLRALQGAEEWVQQVQQSTPRQKPPLSRKQIPLTHVIFDKWDCLRDNISRGRDCIKKPIPRICSNLNVS
jgi:hypothetical protein